MKHFFVTVMMTAGVCTAYGQTDNLNSLGCATVTTAQEIQEVYDFVQGPLPSQKTTAVVDTIPLTIQIVGRDNGTGYYKLDNLFPVICQLNERFAPVGFYFSIKWPVLYIDNSIYYEHDFNGGYQMMQQHNVSGTVNVYFVLDPAGACGYYSPGAGAVAIRNSCSNTNSTTLTHELGHFFGLPHTFYGWENGNTPSNPEKVTRVAGSNCTNAGDGFCDTDADYLGDRWNCPYTGFKLDANGDEYHPDSSIYMSYSTDACMSRFTNMQAARMQNRLVTNYNYLINNNTSSYSALSVPQLVYPTDSLHSNYKIVSWNRVPGAEYYHVKLTNMVNIIREEFLTADTFVAVSFPMIQNSSYKAVVIPLNGTNVCRQNANIKTYVYTNAPTTLNVSNTTVSNAQGLQIAPNPVRGGKTQLLMQTLPAGRYDVVLVNMSGQVVQRSQINHNTGNTYTLTVENLPTGMYFLKVTGNQQQLTSKLMIEQL